MTRKKVEILWEGFCRAQLLKVDGVTSFSMTLADDKADALLKKLDPKTKTTKQRTK